jgi:hypothetical protein
MQDYKLVIRAVTAGATLPNPETGQVEVQNASEFMSYLNAQYLEQGYTLFAVNLLPPDPNLPKVNQFAYHMVKEVKSK